MTYLFLQESDAVTAYLTAISLMSKTPDYVVDCCILRKSVAEVFHQHRLTLLAKMSVVMTSCCCFFFYGKEKAIFNAIITGLQDPHAGED